MNRYQIPSEQSISTESQIHSSPKKRKLTVERSELRSKHIKLIQKNISRVSSVLCIGARDDSEVQDFLDHGFKRAVGVDVSNETDLIIKLDAHQIDTYFKKHEFDVVYASHSLEHMYNAPKVLAAIRHVAYRGAFIILPTSKQPDQNHPCIFDIMPNGPDTLEELQAQPELLQDFSPLSPFVPVHYQSLYTHPTKPTERFELELFFKFEV